MERSLSRRPFQQWLNSRFVLWDVREMARIKIIEGEISIRLALAGERSRGGFDAFGGFYRYGQKLRETDVLYPGN